MKKKLSTFERQLMLDEILFYSICSDQDRQKILDQQPMTFQDFPQAFPADRLPGTGISPQVYLGSAWIQIYGRNGPSVQSM